MVVLYLIIVLGQKGDTRRGQKPLVLLTHVQEQLSSPVPLLCGVVLQTKEINDDSQHSYRRFVEATDIAGARLDEVIDVLL